MLQWMGGSRRKVTASRKSTQKRQKQYFEQRKRQEQRQTSGLESYADGMHMRGQQHKEHRSLDILSLLNLSTIPQDCKYACPSGKKGLDGNASMVKYLVTKDPPTSLNNAVPSANSVEVKGARSLSGYQVETVSSNKVLFSTPDNRNNAFSGINDKPNPCKMDTGQQLSVFDLLGDDGPNGNLEGSPLQEDHVAFSVEGLGKVGTETPVQSPQQPDRIFARDCSLPWKAARRLNSSENFNYVLDDIEPEVDVVMQDINVPLSGSSLEFSMDIMDAYDNRKQKFSTIGDYMQLDSRNSKIKSSFGDAKNFYNIENNNEDIWGGRSSFLDGNFLDWKEDDKYRKNSPCQMDDNSADFLKYGNNEMPDYAFEGPLLMRKRDAAKPTDRFNILESPTPKHLTSESDRDFVNSNGARHPTLGRNFDFGHLSSQSDWSYFVTEDAMDNPSLQSEESCSSSAVRGEATNNSPLNSAARQRRRRHGNAFGSPGNKYGVKDIFLMEMQHKNRDDIQRGYNARGSEKCKRTPISSKSKLPHHINPPFHEKFGSLEHWLSEKGSVDINSSFKSFRQTTEAELPSSGSQLWNDHSFGAFRDPELHIDAISSLDRSQHGETVECSPFGSFISERLAHSKPFIDLNSHGSPMFSKVGSGPSRQDLSADSELEVMPPDSFHDAGSHGEMPSAQGRLSKADGKKLELGKQTCIGKNDLFSEYEMTMGASSFKDSVFECKEAKDGTSELKESLKATYSSEHPEETSSSVKIPNKFESSVDDKEHNHDAEIPLPCQIGSEDLNRGIEDAGPEERKIVSKIGSNCVDASQQVMILQSYVFQLLCVQKVLKEASEQDPMKKV